MYFTHHDPNTAGNSTKITHFGTFSSIPSNGPFFIASTSPLWVQTTGRWWANWFLFFGGAPARKHLPAPMGAIAGRVSARGRAVRSYALAGAPPRGIRPCERIPLPSLTRAGAALRADGQRSAIAVSNTPGGKGMSWCRAADQRLCPCN